VGIPVSLILIAVGAILAFAINQNPGAAVDVDVVGWILMIVGLVGLLLSLLMWERLGPGYL
jgi:phosphate/sulfate permease